MEASLASKNTKRGWLLKRGGLFKKSFVKRYYVLRGDVLEKYASPADSVHGPFKAKGVQKMEGVADVRPNTSVDSKIPKYAFDIYFLNGDIVTFGAENAAERENWVKSFSVFMFAQQKANAKSILEVSWNIAKTMAKAGKSNTLCYSPIVSSSMKGGRTIRKRRMKCTFSFLLQIFTWEMLQEDNLRSKCRTLMSATISVLKTSSQDFFGCMPLHG